MGRKSSDSVLRRVLLVHESYAAPVAGALRESSWPLELLVASGGEMPPGAERTEIYLRAWEGGAARLLARLLGKAPGLRWVHTPSAGVDHLPLPELQARGVVLTNGAGVHSIPMAESVLAYLLARAKRVPEHLGSQHAGRAEPQPLEELFGKELLLFGYGSIAREVAARARAFGMKISAVRRSGAAEEGVDRVYLPARLSEAVAGADVVVAAAPATRETRGIFDARIFAAMKEGCHFVNVARGDLVAEEDLLAGLARGKPAFASLDVAREEPVPAGSPLWSAPNLFLTPHDAWRSPRTKERSLALFLDNLRAYLEGRPMRNVVSYERGY